jgi:tetratricopeptide (TPR) repeat protein
MLETIHEYARERLDDSGESETIKRAHAEYFLTLAEEAEPKLTTAEQGVWLERLETEHDNLRAALSRPLLEEALALYREIGEQRGIGEALGVLELLTTFQGDYRAASYLLEESNVAMKRLGYRRGVAKTLCARGDLALEQRDYKLPYTLYEQALTIFADFDEKWWIAWCLEGIGGGGRSAGSARAGREDIRGGEGRAQSDGHARYGRPPSYLRAPLSHCARPTGRDYLRGGVVRREADGLGEGRRLRAEGRGRRLISLPALANVGEDVLLIPPGPQCGAACSKPEERKPPRNAAFAISCAPLQHVTAHS